jgi:hypothetical protein
MEEYIRSGEIIIEAICGEDRDGIIMEYLTMNFDRTGEAGTIEDIGKTSEIGVPKVDTTVGSTMVSLIEIKEIMVGSTMVSSIVVNLIVIKEIVVKEIVVNLIAINEIVVSSIVVHVLNSTTKVRRLLERQELSRSTKVKRQVSIIKVQEQQ